MARIPNEERFNKQRLGRVLKRATPKQIAWLRTAIEQEQSQRRRTTVERQATADFDRTGEPFPLLGPMLTDPLVSTARRRRPGRERAVGGCG